MAKLRKELSLISAEVLKNTRIVSVNFEFKLTMLQQAFGRLAVTRDYRTWCEEQAAAERYHRYPIVDYLKVVDSRLGAAPVEEKVDTKDVRILGISSMSYEETGYLPSALAVASLLVDFTVAEITGALREYVDALEDQNKRHAMKQFFEGGAQVIILTRRNRG